MVAPALNTNTNAPTAPVIGSLWAQKGLNKHLVARIRPVKEGNLEGGQGAQTYDVDSTQPIIEALLEDGEFSIESQWSTPFEAANPESRLPNLMGLIQSGQASAAYYSFFAAVADPTGGIVAGAAQTLIEESGFKGVLEGAESSLRGLIGKSNFTKLNSRQIYTSSNSVRITGSLIFQAWADARAEVEDAVLLLQQWASPASLSDKSLLVGGISDGFADAMFPSTIPPMVQLQYGAKTYKPMIIESVSAPITAPMTPNGDRIMVRVQVTFLSLTAWDAKNIASTRG